jgi:hypothetical protein
MTDTPAEAPALEWQRIKGGKAGKRPFPYPQIGGMTVSPIYAVHSHHLDELVATIERLTAEVEMLREALEKIRARRYQNRETIDPGNALEAFIRLNREIVTIFDEAEAALKEDRT